MCGLREHCSYTVVVSLSSVLVVGNMLRTVILLVAICRLCSSDEYNKDRSKFLESIILSERVPLVESQGPAPPSRPDRIVGGQETTIEEHPSQVSFIVDKKYFCGGFIVSDQYIITAAHCAQNVDPSTVELRAGSTWRKNGTIIPIAQVTPHPRYNQPQFDNDVAVMKTAERINFTETIQPIPLAPLGRPMKGGTDIIVSGWGRTKFGASTIPERLMDVRIPVVYHLQCLLVYSTVLTDNEFCAGNFFLGGQGTCQGDSGGAAKQDGMAVGIVSYGRGCGQPLSPSVFADIAATPIREFITEQTGL